MGGLLILDAINLLSTVLLNADSVLLARNLKSYKQRGKVPISGQVIYSYEEVKVKVLTP